MHKYFTSKYGRSGAGKHDTANREPDAEGFELAFRLGLGLGLAAGFKLTFPDPDPDLTQTVTCLLVRNLVYGPIRD